jgi:hypothetical protein
MHSARSIKLVTDTIPTMRPILFTLALIAAFSSSLPAEPVQISGIYPHLSMFNDEGECGTGAVVPWAGRLWVVTYAPHAPAGDPSNKLYEITPDLRQIIRPESIGGTPANRLIHEESQQLFIGPYAIDAERHVRAIPYSKMFGRLTGTARHLFDPARKVVTATMEEGIYEIDVRSLAVAELWGDEANKNSPRKANLPGYHGKGFYSGQGVYVYANNGEHGAAALRRPDVPSGILAEWDGRAGAWTLVRRNQFTEVTGPGGIRGNPHPATDPIWAVGWDFKSLILGVRMPDPVRKEDASPSGTWTFYRLPKGSHSYDGAHGWNTEWPRIREIGEKDLLMTMHGTFWRFPVDFTPKHSAGIAPRSNYLKVVGDFCRWNGKLVLGCDDTARNEFLNKRKAKGEIAAPQSQSNFWFLDPAQLDRLGPALGRGAVWVDEAVKADAPSDPYLFSGYDLRGLHLVHDAGRPVTIRLETDCEGDGKWTKLRTVEIPASGYRFIPFGGGDRGAWIRLVPETDIARVSAVFTYRNHDSRPSAASRIFDGLAKNGETLTGGIVRARAKNKRTLSFAAVAAGGSDIGCYELGADLKLRRADDPATHKFTKKHAAIPTGVLSIDVASVLFTDDSGRRWRLPKGDMALARHPLGDYRVAREVATERDLFNADGTFYELPARNAGGFAKIRPVATHNRLVHDYCSYRGLFVVSGVAADAPLGNPHIIRSDDGKTALWVGAIDDIWQLGKPRGKGGPWMRTPAKAGVPSDPYLMTGYDKKSLRLAADKDTTVTAEINITGNGRWVEYAKFALKSAHPVDYSFPDAFSAYWIRFRADRDCTATAILDYR